MFIGHKPIFDSKIANFLSGAVYKDSLRAREYMGSQVEVTFTISENIPTSIKNLKWQI